MSEKRQTQKVLTEWIHLYETVGKANLIDSDRKHISGRIWHRAEHVRTNWEGLMEIIHVLIVVVWHEYNFVSAHWILCKLYFDEVDLKNYLYDLGHELQFCVNQYTWKKHNKEWSSFEKKSWYGHYCHHAPAILNSNTDKIFLPDGGGLVPLILHFRPTSYIMLWSYACGC